MVISIILIILGLKLDEHLFYLLGLIFSLSLAYLLAIWWEKIKAFFLENGETKLDIKDIIDWKAGIGGIVRFFVIILILMSIGRLGNVIIYESMDSLYPVLLSEDPNKFKSFFENLQPNYIRSEIGRILFLIILINIFSIIPDLINEDKDLKEKKFFNLIITSLLLALILTLAPEGDIGTIKLNMSFESAISSFLLIISIILIYYFKNVDIKNWFKKN